MTANAIGAILAACIGAVGVILAARVSSQIARIKGDLDACLRDRRQLRQLVQLIAGAFVGTLPERERLSLLRRIDETLETDEAA